jgi:hypothetical protein
VLGNGIIHLSGNVQAAQARCHRRQGLASRACGMTVVWEVPTGHLIAVLPHGTIIGGGKTRTKTNFPRKERFCCAVVDVALSLSFQVAEHHRECLPRDFWQEVSHPYGDRISYTTTQLREQQVSRECRTGRPRVWYQLHFTGTYDRGGRHRPIARPHGGFSLQAVFFRTPPRTMSRYRNGQ